MKKLYTKMSLALMSLLVIFGAQYLHAQQIDYEWGFATGPSGISSETATGICFDIDGNMYVTGTFQGTVDFDPSPSSVTMTSVGNGTGENSFILKFDTDSTLIWAKQFEGNDNFGYGITYDGDESLYVIGSSYALTDFDPGTGVTNASPGNFGMYTCKLDTAGNFQWVRKAINGGGPNAVGLNFVEYDDLSNSVVVGGFYVGNALEVADENGSITGGITLPLTVGRHFATISYSETGDLQWASEIAGGTLSRFFDMELDSQGNIYMCGRFQGTVDMDPTSGVDNVTNVGNIDGFITKLTPQGNYLGNITVPGTVNTEVYEMGIDENDSLTIAITYTGDVTLGAEFGLTQAQTESTVGLHDVLFIKTDSDFNAAWYKTLGGASATGSDFIWDIVTKQNTIYVGFISNSPQFDFDPSSSSTELAGAGDYDIFTAVYTANGDLIDAVGFGGVNRDILEAFAVRSDGTIATGGYFESPTIDLDPTSGVDSYNNQSQGGSSAHRDIYFNQMRICAITIDNSTTDDGTTITANENAASASYQWIDCSDDSEINGETNASYTPVASGDYACIITNGCAVDTTDCVSITVQTTAVDSEFKSMTKVFPNPVNDMLYIDSNEKIQSLKIFSATGQLMYVANQETKSINTASYPSGIYFIQINTTNNVQSIKLIKK